MRSDRARPEASDETAPKAGPTRRAALAGLAAMGLAWSARAAEPPRLAAIDWAMLETAIAIGHPPVAACELLRFREDTGDTALPPATVDLGLRGSPNLELLQLTRPTLILSSPYYTEVEPRLAAIAPVMALPFFVPDEPPLPKAISALHQLAAAVEDPAAGARAEAEADAAFAAVAARVARYRDRPFLVIDIGDARHVRVFGADSLFGGALDRLGLRNAWTEGTRFAFSAPIPIDRLAPYEDAWLVLPGGIPVVARSGLATSILWNRLGPVAGGRLLSLPNAYGFGGVPSALRFAALVADALEGAA